MGTVKVRDTKGNEVYVHTSYFDDYHEEYIRDLYTRIEDLEDQVQSLQGLLAARKRVEENVTSD